MTRSKNLQEFSPHGGMYYFTMNINIRVTLKIKDQQIHFTMIFSAPHLKDYIYFKVHLGPGVPHKGLKLV